MGLKYGVSNISVVQNGVVDILVENCGRINYGRDMVGEHKGLRSIRVGGVAPAGVLWLCLLQWARSPLITCPSIISRRGADLPAAAG